MTYEATPVEPTPQPSAYDHLPPYTSLAPARRAATATTPPPARQTAARTATVPRAHPRLAVSILSVAVGLFMLAVLNPPPPSLEQILGQTRVSAPSFSVQLLDGGRALVRESGIVLDVTSTSSGETFIVWADASGTVPPCDVEVEHRVAELTGTRTPVTTSLDGSVATGTRVSYPPLDHTIVCTQRAGTRYVVEDFSVLSTSSFSILAASWRWS